MLIHDQIKAYEDAGTLVRKHLPHRCASVNKSIWPPAFIQVGESQIVNITALVGQKGDNYFECGDSHSGSNVLSVGYHPSAGVMFTAWEAFAGAQWRPAACNTYLRVDMNRWWN